MQSISEEKINEIRNSADIVSIISDYIPLKMHGKNYFGICPFHDDHTPSMSVSKDRQLFKCFVCNKGGNVFTFVKDYENISYIEAVKRVADKVGIPLDINITKKNTSKYQKEYEIMEYATKIFQNNLNSKAGKDAKEYLESRSITEDIIKDFQIGLAIDDKTYLYNALVKKNYDLNVLDELGLINKDGLTGYDKFQNRIMFPITNLDGAVVGYTGRIFNGEDSAKYINTKETSIYKKGNILFNYYNAKNYIRDNKYAILVEGNMDAIRVYSSGVKNVLALMGTAITKEQIDILKKLHVPIILMLDNDNAGALATHNIGLEFNKQNIETKVVRLSGAKDPDEYIVKFGVEGFKSAIKHSISFLDFELNYLKEGKDLTNTEELIKYIKEVLSVIEDKDNLTKEITIKKISDEYNISYDTLKQEVNFESEKKETPRKIIPSKKINDKYQVCAYTILYFLMSDEKYIKIFNTKLGYLKNSNERDLVSEIEYYIKKYGKINLADFISYAENYDIIKDLVNTICETINFEELDDQIFMDYIKALSDILRKENIKEIKNKIHNSVDINEQIDNINKQIAIAKKMIDEKKEV